MRKLIWASSRILGIYSITLSVGGCWRGLTQALKNIEIIKVKYPICGELAVANSLQDGWDKFKSEEIKML